MKVYEWYRVHTDGGEEDAWAVPLTYTETPAHY